MNLKTATWNIGGGKAFKVGQNPRLTSSYTEDGLDDIAEWLKEAGPDIIALQEVHGTDERNQVEYIADKLEYEYYFWHATSISFIDKSQQIGNGIISRFPTSEHRAGTFYNPKLPVDLEDGGSVISHDKGYGTCLIDVNGQRIRTTTLHLLPFHIMDIELNSEVANKILSSVVTELQDDGDFVLIHGDFNIDEETVGKYLPKLLGRDAIPEIKLQEPTTPKGRKYDHVLYRGFTLKKVQVDSTVKTDHYPVSCDFEILE